jgi:hypothetical protein
MRYWALVLHIHTQYDILVTQRTHFCVLHISQGVAEEKGCTKLVAEMFVHRGSGVDSCAGASALAKEGICVRIQATDDLLQGVIMAMVRPSGLWRRRRGFKACH